MRKLKSLLFRGLARVTGRLKKKKEGERGGRSLKTSEIRNW